MGYYIRVLSTSKGCIPLATLQSALKQRNLEATLSGDEPASEDWEQLVLQHSDGVAIASIERNPVEDGSLGAEELTEFADSIADAKPAPAVTWLREYFKRVGCIYAFQVLNGTEHKNGWDILDVVRLRVWSFAPGILQADSEGFANEEGAHILWQFNDSVDGPLDAAILRDRKWLRFTMDLGNRKHREAFMKNEVPGGAQLSVPNPSTEP